MRFLLFCLLLSSPAIPGSAFAQEPCCPVIELRQYTLRPGQRDILVELFDNEFVDPLETAGMQVIGQHHDLDRPDMFVWLRGFSDLLPMRASR
jgi:hypothetical protein